ncbi:hypothetical protein BX616_010393 [Lobosporangium transversale]|nr:hypothetical protein BX616_010393 [Lobosporangium transversale]
MVFWKRSLPPVTHVYQESIAHRVRDILTGTDHPSQKQRDKAAIKALQRPEALAGVIEILKTMPEPGPQADDWGNSADDSSYGEGEAKQKQKQSQGQEPVQPVQALFKENDNKSNIKKSGDNSKNSKPNGTTIVAATTIAAAAATSAAAAALAVSNRKKNRSTTVKESTVTDKNTTITTKTIVRFHPSKDTVSSCA